MTLTSIAWKTFVLVIMKVTNLKKSNVYEFNIQLLQMHFSEITVLLVVDDVAHTAAELRLFNKIHFLA